MYVCEKQNILGTYIYLLHIKFTRFFFNSKLIVNKKIKIYILQRLKVEGWC